LERRIDAFDYFIHFAHAFELGLQTGVSRFFGVVTVFWARGLVYWGFVEAFLGCYAAVRAREDVFVIVSEA
jgi:hypothetical protein